MAQTTFEDRLKRLDAKAPTPKAPSPSPAASRKRPAFLVTALIGTVCLVVGFAGAFVVTLALDPDMTPQAAHYVELMLLAGAFVVLMLGAGVASLITRLRRPILNRIALFTLAGYGITSTLLTQVIT